MVARGLSDLCCKPLRWENSPRREENSRGHPARTRQLLTSSRTFHSLTLTGPPTIHRGEQPPGQEGHCQLAEGIP